jgi:uncharacterized protein (TIGR02391 family)
VTNWYVEIQKLLRSIRRKALEAAAARREDQEELAVKINEYAKLDFVTLQARWSEKLPAAQLGSDLARHLHFGELHDYVDILLRDIPRIEEVLDEWLLEQEQSPRSANFRALLHPAVSRHALPHFDAGHLREAVLNGVLAVFDLLRERTGLDGDGAVLVSQALSLENPKLIFSELSTESGRNDQKGFLQILQGAYLGIRNPKAHSLRHDLTEFAAAQYLIFASLLARRIEEAVQT